VGGGGVAPLSCSEPDICELQKMYFLPTARGQGLAKKLALMALDHARKQGFTRCYLKQPPSSKRPSACMNIWALSISMRRWAVPATLIAKSGC
jgi:putative acetyltransferase